MINAFRKISAMFLIPLLVFASGGLNIFSHYCHTQNSGKISIISSPECEHVHHNCCHEKEMTHCNNLSSDGTCCESNHTFIKTVEWNFVENPLEIEKSVCEPQTMITTELDIPEYDNSIPLGFRYVDYSSPPEYSPKYITILQQKLRIAC
ncbi:MAG: hypothetical protein C0592_08515 [Marinilabiliales bacterium]|nr:MAG: hypothetical protein C0592_08515 [Marinilabiliales bacterium]